MNSEVGGLCIWASLGFLAGCFGMEWEGAGLRLTFGPWVRSASPCIHACSHPALFPCCLCGGSHVAFTLACVQVWVCWSPWKHQHFLRALHKPVECEAHRAISVLQHLTFQEKLKHPKMVMMNVLRKN